MSKDREEAAELQLVRQLGVTSEEVDAQTTIVLGVPKGTSGLVLTSVADGQPGDKAGLQAGDVVEQIGGFPVPDSQTAVRALTETASPSVALLVNRRGRELRVRLTRCPLADGSDLC